jgi:hypothetical protein
VWVGDGSAPPVPLASSNQGFYDFGDEAHLNNSGVAAFRAFNSNDDEGVFTAGPGGIGTVALAGPGDFGFSEPSINNAGTVVFAVRGTPNRIVTAPASGGPITIVASEGPGFDDYWNFELPLINDNGDVVFFAELGSFDTGLFDGGHPMRDRIIMTGQTLFGSTLEEIYFQLPPMFKALNNDGQVAFSYRLSDDRHGIAIATPAPYGDANADGTVNLTDFNTLAANFGQSGRNWTTADFTGDGLVNLDDFNRLAANFGVTATGPHVTPEDWSALAAAIPEPALIGFAAVWMAAALRPRRRRSCWRR